MKQRVFSKIMQLNSKSFCEEKSKFGFIKSEEACAYSVFFKELDIKHSYNFEISHYGYELEKFGLFILIQN